MVATGWGAKTPEELDELGTPEWVIDGILPKECAGVVFAKSGVGKTFFVLGMACAIATGSDWYGHAVKQGGVLYIAAEGYRGIRQRQRAWETHHGLTLPATLRVMHQRVDLQDADEVAAFIAWVKQKYPDVRLVRLTEPNRVVDWRHEYATDQRHAVGDRRSASASRTTQAQRWTTTQHHGPRRAHGHHLCLKEWHPMGDAAPGTRLRERHDLLEALT